MNTLSYLLTYLITYYTYVTNLRAKDQDQIFLLFSLLNRPNSWKTSLCIRRTDSVNTRRRRPPCLGWKRPAAVHPGIVLPSGT